MSENIALLVIDMQSGLLRRDIYKKQELIENVNCLLDVFYANNLPVFLFRHTNQGFSQINTGDWQIDNSIRQNKAGIIIDKTHSSVFKERTFTAALEYKGITRIVICGLVTNGCIQAACLDGVRRGLEVFLVNGTHSTWHKDAERIIAEWSLRLESENIKNISLHNISAILGICPF